MKNSLNSSFDDAAMLNHQGSAKKMSKLDLELDHRNFKEGDDLDSSENEEMLIGGFKLDLQEEQQSKQDLKGYQNEWMFENE